MDAGSKKASLDSMSKEELVGRCKNLLQLAQRAKSAKDDLQQKLDAKQEECMKQKEDMEVLAIKNEENDDIIKVKQRQLDRISDENESLLQQMDTYCTQLKAVAKEKGEIEGNFKSIKEELSKSERRASKAMELEATLICLRENEKKLLSKVDKLEVELGAEQKMVKEQNTKITNLSTVLENTQDSLNNEKSRSKDLEAQIADLNSGQNDTDQLVEKVSDLENQRNDLEAQLVMKDGEINGHLQEVDKLRVQIRQMEADNSANLIELTKKVSEDEEKIRNDHKFEMEQLRQNFSEEKDVADEENAALLKEKKDIEAKNAGLIEDLNLLNEEMKKRGERLDKMEQNNLELSEKVKNFEKINKAENSATTELESLKIELEEKSNLLHSSEDERNQLSEKVKSLELGSVEKVEQIEVLEKKVENYEAVNAKLTCNISENASGLTEKEAKIESLISELETLQISKDREVDTLNLAVKEKQFKIEDLIKTSSKSDDDKVESLQRKISSLESEVSSLQSTVTKCKEENEEFLKEKLKTSEELKGETERKTNLEDENSRLKEEKLKALKAFDDVAESKSHLEEEVRKLANMNQQSVEQHVALENELKSLREEKSHLSKENQSLHVEVNQLKASITELKEDISKNKSFNTSSHEMDDSRSEVMSTSTVSRVEEVNRMKDVEDSFEERYSKLKLIAIKLKKKVADQDKVIKELESSKREKTAEDDSGSGALKERVATLTKNFSNLQLQYDEAVDKLDSSNAEMKTLKKDLEASITENIAAKQRSEEAVQQSLAAKTELTRAEERVREAEAQCRALEVTLDQERRERRTLETSCKNNEELSLKLKEKMDENTMIGETVESLKLQVSQLEETLDREKDRADTAQSNLTSTRTHLTQVETEISRIKIEKDEIFLKYERSIQSTESLQEQLASNIQEKDKSGTEQINKIQQLERQISALETNMQLKNQNLESRDKELNQVNKEFENYKLRAQSVLKQSKEKDSEEVSKRKQDDIFALEKMNDALNEKLKSLGVELRTLTIERNGIQEEHDRLMSRHSVLMQEAAAKEKSWREKMEQREQVIKQGEEDKAGSIERVQKSIENLKASHRQELEMMKTSAAAEVSKLKQQLDTTENEVIRLEIVMQKETEARRLAEEMLGGYRGRESLGRGDTRLDIREIEREACEGQEQGEASLGPAPGTAVTSPLPLDQLLAQADLPDDVSDEIRSTATSRAGGVEKQLGHMAALLAESEAHNTRLEKLTEVLKEEIRTYQRSEERHKHIENLEYVKNVIMKFLTLSRAEERVNLLPVLQTILKLKKEEVTQIQQYINVEETSTRDSEGWSSYLGLWSGP